MQSLPDTKPAAQTRTRACTLRAACACTSLERQRIVLLAGLALLWLSLATSTQAATIKYWIGPADGNFATNTSWSLSSGGPNDTTAPGNLDLATFDGNANTNCTLAANVNVAGINILSGYTATLTQSAGVSVTCGTSNFAQADGVFSGGDSAINFNGTFSLSGGIFRATSAILTAKGNWSVSGGTFDPRTGTVIFNKSLTITGSHGLNHVTLLDSQGLSLANNDIVVLAAGTTVTVNGLLSFNDPGGDRAVVNGPGEFKPLADINIIGVGYRGTAVMVLEGAANQSLTGTATGNACIPGLTINKALGTLTLLDTIRVSYNWTYQQGALSVGTSTMIFGGRNSAGNTSTITGSHTLNNVTFADSHGSSITNNDIVVIAVGTTLTVGGTLTLSDSGGDRARLDGPGTIKPLGDIYTTGIGFRGNAILLLDGNANQTLTGTADGNACIPGLTINKALGTLTLLDSIRVTFDWTYQQGALDVGTSTLIFGCRQSAGTTTTLTGSLSLNNVAFADSHGSSVTNNDLVMIAAGTTLTVNGTLTFSDSGGDRAILNGPGSLKPLGDIYTTGLGFRGDAVLILDGPANQTLTGTADGNACIPGLTINKANGTLTLLDAIRVTFNWTYQQGALIVGTSTLIFGGRSSAGTTSTITGSYTLNNVSFEDYQATSVATRDTVVIAAGTTLTINGTLAINDAGGLVARLNGPGAIAALGDVTTSGVGQLGTVGITLSGGATQNITASGTNFPGTTLTLNKSAGSAALAADLVLNAAGQNLTLTAGTFDLAGHNLTVNSALTLGASGELKLFGDETITRGSLTIAPGSTVSYYGAGTYASLLLGNSYSHLSFAGAGEWTHTAPLALGGNLTITQGTLNSTGQNVTLAGSWSNAGSYNPGNNTVLFTGATVAISGNTSFNHFTAQTPSQLLTFQAGSRQTVLGTLTLNGQAVGTRLQLRSSTPDTQYEIDPRGARSITFVDVKDSNNLTLPTIEPAGSLDSGNNVRWFHTAPLAQNGALSTNEDTPATATLVASDLDGDPLNYLIMANGTKGSAVITNAATGAYTYTPHPDANGTDTFTFKANDGTADSNVATITVTITAVNDAPVATHDAYTVNQGQVLTLATPGVLSNDLDVDGDSLSAVLVSAVSQGTLALNADGSFNYTPAASFSGTDSFTYRASDGVLSSNPAMVTLTVAPSSNAAPVANADQGYSVNAGAVLIGTPGVLANDLDPDGDALTAVLVSGTSGGTLTLNADGSFTYQPGQGFLGSDSFSYQAFDGKLLSNIAQVTLSVQAQDSGTDLDSDGDGFTDPEEIAAGASPYDSKDAPAGLKLLLVRGLARFTTPGQDAWLLTAELPGVALPLASGTSFEVDLGGAKTSFTLNAAGKGRSEFGTASLTLNRRTGVVLAKLRVVRGSWALCWQSKGLDPAAARQNAALKLIAVIRLGQNAHVSTSVNAWTNYLGKGARFSYEAKPARSRYLP